MFHEAFGKESPERNSIGSAGTRLIYIAGRVLVSIAALAVFEAAQHAWCDTLPFRGTTSPYGTAPLTVQQSQLGDDELPGNPNDDDFFDATRRFRSHDRGRVYPSLAPPHELAAPRERLVPARNRDEDRSSDTERIQRKLTSRYGNPATVQMLQALSPEQSLEFYREVSRLIDTRHLNPSSYEARIHRAVNNLRQAIRNRAFRQASGLSDDPTALDTFRRELLPLADGRVVDETRASELLRRMMQMGHRDAGLTPASVALEFVFGATDSLDQFSGFVPATKQGNSLVELEGHIVGIGVEIAPHDGGMRIVRALPSSPAAEAGLKAGDLIESIDGREMSGATLQDAVSLIAGPAGSRLTLRVRRDARVAQITLVRREVDLHSVSEATILDQNVGYIKLEKFAETSSEEFDGALIDLNRRGMRSLIVDLRGNPGGLLTTAIELSSKFIPCGPIVSTRGRNPSDNTVEYSHSGGSAEIPLVVLVDEQSASASEIFAAAIQDNERGLIVGRRTYGKGTVQTHFPLQSVSGDLVLTTARFLSPRGRLIESAGVEPDVYVQAGRFDRSSPEPLGASRIRPGTAWARDPDIAAAFSAATSERLFERRQSRLPLSAGPMTVTDASFSAVVERSPRPVLVEFWAPWCSRCRILAPTIDELASEMEGRVQFARVDLDENPVTAGRFNVGSVPTLLLLKDGREIDRIVGVQPKSEIIRRLEGSAFKGN
jgi:carboxyl-terminal processing protease